MNNLINDYNLLSTEAREFFFKNHPMVVGGNLVTEGRAGELAIIDPTNGKEVGRVPSASELDVDLAVRTARTAFVEGPWSRMSPGGRERALLKLADLIERDAGLFAEIEAVESGRTLANTRAFDGDLPASCFRYMAGWATKLDGKTLSLTIPYAPALKTFAYTRYEPVGVVAAITPWNVPLCQAAWKIAPALAAGCTIVLKPSELTPLGAIHLGRLALEAGIPEGVVNIVTGTGNVAGRALVSHPLVSKISFTGSTAVGREIAVVAAKNFKKVTLELGGKSPMVMLADADLDNAIAGGAMAIFANHGQNCCAGSRLYVHRSIHDKVVAGISAIAEAMNLGSPLDPASEMGPLVSLRQQQRVLEYIQSARDEGAEVVAGGRSLDHAGAYVRPTVLAGVRQDMKVVREEIFGPVLSVMPFDDESEALRLANDTDYGLGASVWTRDVNKVHAFTEGLKAGTVWVNVHNVLDMAMPFGGIRNSGMGHDLGQESVLANCNIKASVINLN